MLRGTAFLTAVVFLPATCLLADFSFDETSKVTGGMLAGVMKFAGAFSKQAREAREPNTSTVAVKGDRMVHLSAHHAAIIDLSKETVTSIDFDKKQYSVMTFAEMQQMMEQMSEKMKSSKDAEKADVSFSVSVKDTGQKRQIAGFDTHEMVLTMEMQSTDPQSGNKGTISVAASMWLAPKVAGYEEIRNFYRRMAQKLNWMPGGSQSMMSSRPDLARGLAQVYKEGAKLDGVPVLQIVKMGMQGEGQAQAQGSAPPQSQSGDQRAERPSIGGALGGALAGRLGGFGRKKKTQEQTESSGQEQAASSQGAQSVSVSGSLLEMTTEMSGFSAASVDASKFEAPAGFQKVDAAAQQRRR